MIFGEYSYEDDIRVQRKEAYDDGIIEGMKQGVSVGIAQQKAKDEKLLKAERNRVAQKDAEIERLKSLLAQK